MKSIAAQGPRSSFYQTESSIGTEKASCGERVRGERYRATSSVGIAPTSEGSDARRNEPAAHCDFISTQLLENSYDSVGCC